MSEVTRRRALQVLTTGAAALAAGGVGAAGASLASGAEGAVASSGSPQAAATAGREAARQAAPDAARDAARAAARAVARRLGCPVSRHPGSTAGEAEVLLCRSWDRSVYLYASAEVRGFVDLDERGFAIAAACQAAGRRVAFEHWGYAPDWAGVGRFEGALVAIDPRDLAGSFAPDGLPPLT